MGGLVLATHPVAAVPELLPCVGRFLGGIVSCILCSLCLCVSVGLSALVCGVAWFAARPLWGGLLVTGAAAVFIGAYYIHNHGRKIQGSGTRYPLTPGTRSSGLPSIYSGVDPNKRLPG